jgi:hypothetical protein
MSGVRHRPSAKAIRFWKALSALSLFLIAISSPTGAKAVASSQTGAPTAETVLGRVYDASAKRDLARAERDLIPILARQTSISQSSDSIYRLKQFMINALFQHDRKTYFCNALAENWSSDENALARALDICTSSSDESQDLCRLFYHRLPSIRRLMRNFAVIYRDERIELSQQDIEFWYRLLSCSSTETGHSPPTQIRYISDILGEFTDRSIRGLVPYDTATAGDIAEFNQITMSRYYYILYQYCAFRPERDLNLLRTMECRAVGLREHTRHE